MKNGKYGICLLLSLYTAIGISIPSHSYVRLVPHLCEHDVVKELEPATPSLFNKGIDGQSVDINGPVWSPRTLPFFASTQSGRYLNIFPFGVEACLV
jgi:hypothetical protein